MAHARVRVKMLVTGAACVAAGTGLWGCKGDKPSTSSPPPAASSPASSAPQQPPPATLSEPPNPVNLSRFAGPDAYDAPALSRFEMPSGVIIEDLIIGQGEPALPRAFVTFHYRGKVKGGEEFHATTQTPDGPRPEEQSLDRLIPGLSSGMVGMKAGGRRRVTVPPELAPGIAGLKDEQGNFRIPPDATLIYIVDAVAIRQQLVPGPGGGS